MGKTSLQKSHSKTSNFKLTFICFIAAFAISALWIGLALIKANPTFGYILLPVGAVATIISLFFISKFTR